MAYPKFFIIFAFGNYYALQMENLLAHDNPLVSIITPLYNGEKFIAETIESVQRQSYPFWEMIVTDDGSSDHGPAIVAAYASDDHRIRLLHHLGNKGCSAARNTSLRAATGRYIALLDADDLWDPEFLATHLDFQKTRHIPLSFCAYRHIDEKGSILLPYIGAKRCVDLRDIKRLPYIGSVTSLYDSFSHGKVFFREELGSLRDDYAYFIDLIKKTGRAYGIDRVMASHRRVEGSVTAGDHFRKIPTHYRFLRTHAEVPPAMALLNAMLWGLRGLCRIIASFRISFPQNRRREEPVHSYRL